MMGWIPINLDLLKNPLNWLIVFFMVTLALIPLTLLFHNVSRHTA